MRKVLLVSALIAACVSAQAVVTQVGTRAALLANDSIDWNQFGADYTTLGTSTLGTTALGGAFLLSGNAPQLRTENDSWYGNFNDGDKLIWSQGSGDLTIQFAATQGALGFDIMANYYGQYTGSIKAYNGLGMLLGTFSVAGVSSDTDGTAAFLGIRSTQMDIAKVVISSVDQFNGNDFAINNVSLGNCQAVPEPASMAALGLGALGLLKRRKKA